MVLSGASSRTSAATPSLLRPPSSTRSAVTPASAAQVALSSGPASVLRCAASTTIGRSARSWAKPRSTCSVAPSARCRSSRTTSSGPSAVTCRRRSATALASSNADSQFGAGSPSACTTSDHAHAGGAPSTSGQRPRATVHPSRPSRSPITSARVVLPAPGSAPSQIVRSPAVSAVAAAAVIRCTSAERPIRVARCRDTGAGNSLWRLGVSTAARGAAGRGRSKRSSDCSRIFASSVRNAGPGSMPSSSANRSRIARSCASASRWRPTRYSASASNRAPSSLSGSSVRWRSSSGMTRASHPRSSPMAAYCSTAAARIRASRAASVAAQSVSQNSWSTEPLQQSNAARNNSARDCGTSLLAASRTRAWNRHASTASTGSRNA